MNSESLDLMSGSIMVGLQCDGVIGGKGKRQEVRKKEVARRIFGALILPWSLSAAKKRREAPLPCASTTQGSAQVHSQP